MLATKTDASLDQESRLDALLSENIQSARQRERTTFDELAAPFEKRIVIFGRGLLGRKILFGLRRAGLEPLCFADNNSAFWGKSTEGLQVLPPAQAASKFGDNAAFLVAVWNSEASDKMADRTKQLTKLGCKKVIPAGFLFWKYAEVFLPHYAMDLPHKVLECGEDVRSAFHLCCDDASKAEYVAQIRFRLQLDFDGLGGPLQDHYFPRDIYQLGANETLIDCGAFDGDTIQGFLRLQDEHFTRIIAYEPDHLNWDRLAKTTESLPANVRAKITCFPNAVGSSRGRIHFEATGTPSSACGTGSGSVECVTLDDSLNGIHPTIIKFDIEGAELEAIRGGSQTIHRDHPVLAVSAYHKQSHIWEVPLLISQLANQYRFFLRPHGPEAWDLVCYAIPPSRLVVGHNAGAQMV